MENPAAESKSNESAANAFSNFTPMQLRKVAAVYDFLARMLPTEGKDYSIKFTFPAADNPNRISVKFEPFTKIGKIWCDYCSDLLKHPDSHEKIVS